MGVRSRSISSASDRLLDGRARTRLGARVVMNPAFYVNGSESAYERDRYRQRGLAAVRGRGRKNDVFATK